METPSIDSVELGNLRAMYKAIDRSQAVIEFDCDGIIQSANENFLSVLGYRLEEIVGQHHKMFVQPKYASSEEYAEFWRSLRHGEFQSAEYMRVGKGGKTVWIQATYNPILDEEGNVAKVVKFAVDITRQKLAAIDAINKTQACIEFKPDGTIITANANFCDAMGYSLDAIEGRHHRMFCNPEWSESAEYARFWRDLAAGNFQQDQYCRVNARGDKIWLQATYNPVFDSRGNVEKVVKYATDITRSINAKSQARKIGDSIAASVQEMACSIGEISKNVNRTAAIAQSAKTDAGNTETLIEQLDESSDAIGRVVSVIQDLAEQTNMLALNAAIEAARAGDVGRGFSVVANEVKALAGQTGKATQSISSSVSEIQGKISTVVDSIREISSGVTQVSENTSSVAAAVEQQSCLMTGLSSTAQELIGLSD